MRWQALGKGIRPRGPAVILPGWRDREPLILHREPRFNVSLLANRRPRVILNAEWHADVGRYMSEHGLTDISLNGGCGWPGGGIEFLAEIPGLRTAAILHSKTRDVLPLLAHAATLEESILDCNVVRAPGFSSLPALRNFNVTWARGLADVFDGTPHPLEKLCVQRWPWEDLGSIVPLRSLRGVCIAGSRKLVEISALRVVAVSERILDTDLSVLQRLPALEWAGIRSRKSRWLNVKQLHASLESRRNAR